MFAYFDAATGGMLLSAIAAGAAGIAMAGKSVWYKLAFWRKTEENPVDQAVQVDLDDLDDVDGLEIGEIDDAELDVT
ncbi:MAG: hypothetical protein OEW42_12370 [Acidimicrobiia bacterium]|nr:hypothetical protein [Acidimicrobiia bacterium]MDH5237135.1 hypothetical protein [Acidimicrobiia bacterium]